VEYEVKITSEENMGRGVGKINDKVVFVSNALKDEIVLVKITEEKKKYSLGIATKILEKSKNRCEPQCKYYDKCGGCHIMHQLYDEQKKFKQNKVKQILEKIGKLTNVKVNELVSNKQFNYRNKAIFHIDGKKIGFYSSKTNEVIDIEECIICDDKINEILKIVKQYLKNTKTNLKELMLRTSKEDVLISIKGDYDIQLINILKEKSNNIIYNDKVVIGKDYVIQETNGLKFNNSVNSFFQVNKYVTEKLYDYVRKLSNESESALDLYSGTGTISLILSNSVKKVTGIEIVKSAIEDAKENARINNIDNVNFILGDVSKEIIKLKNKVDLVVLDPPRSGSDEKTLDKIVELSPQKIIYISCDPVTLARDLKYLTGKNYELKEVTPFDMFPNTYHVECVCV